MYDETYTYRLIEDGRAYQIYRGRSLIAGGYLKSREAAIDEAKRHIVRLQRGDRATQREVA